MTFQSWLTVPAESSWGDDVAAVSATGLTIWGKYYELGIWRMKEDSREMQVWTEKKKKREGWEWKEDE